MKKRTLILFMLLGFCVALPGCGGAEKQHKSQNEYNQSSSKDDSEDDSKDDSKDDSDSSTEDDSDSSTEDDFDNSTGDDSDSSTNSNNGSSPNSSIGSSANSSTGSSPNSSTGSSANSSTGSSANSNNGSSTGSSTNGNPGNASVTTPIQESKVIKSIAAINKITVDYGTDEADAKKKLPGKVECKTNDGKTVSANVTWKRESGETYNATPDKDKAVVYVGTVTIPNGYTYTGKQTVTAKITVRGGSKTIKGLSASVKDITVDYNTSEADAKKQLPDKVKLKTYTGKTVSAKVTWKRKSGKTYNATPDKDKAVVYVGTVTIPKGYSYTDKLTVTAKITVRGSKTIKGLSASVSDFAVDYNTSEADAMAKLPDKISLKTYDGKTVSAKVTWKRKSGETYTAAMDSDTVIVYVGTVTIPKGYTYTGKLTVTAKITVRSGNKTIQGLLSPINDVTVDYNTSEADAKKHLPGKVELKTYDGKTVSANVTWARKSGETYNEKPASAATVAYVGTVTIPDGYTYTGKLTVTAKITVRGGDRIIKGLAAAVSGIEVDYNTSEADVKKRLPDEMELQTYAGKTVPAKVTWNLKSGETYNATPDSDLAVTYVGTVTIPNGYTCADTLTAEMTITVHGGDRTIKELIGPSEGFEVEYGMSETDAKEYLPGEVGLRLYRGASKFATVTWIRKDDETYNATPASNTTVTYIGTVQIPDGYYFESNTTIKTTIETTITVLKEGTKAKNKKIENSAFVDDIFIESYIPDENELKKQLPDIARLYSEEGYPVTVKLDNAKWQYDITYESNRAGYETKYEFKYSYKDIALPKGYEFKESINKYIDYHNLSCAVYIKARDDSGLKEAEETADALLNRITASELAALVYPDMIYKVQDGTMPSDVSTGVMFIEKKLIEKEENELNTLSAQAVSYCENGDKSQAEVDKLAEELNEASAALKAILDNNYQIGTGYTEETILFNVWEKLKSFEGNSNYAYDPANQPLKPQQSAENCLTFPSKVRVAINADGDLADVQLNWTIADDTNAEIRENNGTQYVWVKVLDEPKDISFTVTATGYEYPAGNWISLNKQVEAYNNCIAGAQISKYEGNVYERDIPKLTSGKDYSSESFDVVIPMNNLIHPLIEIETSEPDRIKAEDVSEYNKGTLFDSLKVVKIENGASYLGTCPYFWLTAKVAQLPAVIDPTSADEYVKGKVKLSIPADAITLTQYAVEQGWYIPDNEWEEEVDVWVYNPAVKVQKAERNGDEVNVTFSTTHWNGSSDIRMALVPSTEDTFDGTATDSFVSSTTVKVDADKSDTVKIPVSGIQSKDYTVWVKVGNEQWQQSTYVFQP